MMMLRDGDVCAFICSDTWRAQAKCHCMCIYVAQWHRIIHSLSFNGWYTVIYHGRWIHKSIVKEYTRVQFVHKFFSTLSLSQSTCIGITWSCIYKSFFFFPTKLDEHGWSFWSSPWNLPVLLLFSFCFERNQFHIISQRSTSSLKWTTVYTYCFQAFVHVCFTSGVDLAQFSQALIYLGPGNPESSL